MVFGRVSICWESGLTETTEFGMLNKIFGGIVTEPASLEFSLLVEMPLVVTRNDVPGIKVPPLVVMKDSGNPIVWPLPVTRADPTLNPSGWLVPEIGELPVSIDRVSVFNGLEFSFKWSPFELLELMLLARDKMSDSLRWITLEPRDADGGSSRIWLGGDARAKEFGLCVVLSLFRHMHDFLWVMKVSRDENCCLHLPHWNTSSTSSSSTDQGQIIAHGLIGGGFAYLAVVDQEYPEPQNLNQNKLVTEKFSKSFGSYELLPRSPPSALHSETPSTPETVFEHFSRLMATKVSSALALALILANIYADHVHRLT